MGVVINLDAAVSEDCPHELEFLPGLPLANLIDVWHAYRGLSYNSLKVVSAWEGWNGGSAVPASSGTAPVYVADGMDAAPDVPSLEFGGSKHLEITNLPPTAGYVVVALEPRSVGSTRVWVGAQQDSTNRFNVFGNSSSKASFTVGNKTLVGTTTLVNGTKYVIGAFLDTAGNVTALRVNGVVEDTDTVGGTVGNRPLWFGAQNNAGIAANACIAGIGLIGIYGGAVLTNEQLNAIDMAAGAVIGLDLDL